MSNLRATLEFPGGEVDKATFPTGLFINNKFVDSVEGKTFEVYNPANGKAIASVAEAGAKDVDIAVDAAQKAYDTAWGLKVPGGERGKLMNKLADKIEENTKVLAAIESLDNGKTIYFSKIDIANAVKCIRYYAGWADKNHGQVIEVDDSKFAYTRHEPIGVVGQIIPWNFPFMMLSWKIGPALATGNTIILKPAEQTPLTALYFCQFVAEIFPPGVLNIVSGFGAVAGAAIASHMKIEKVAFTGSTPVGRSIMKAAANSNLKKVTLELGGKSPSIVFEDADLDQAAKWAGFGLFFNHGQTCCAGSRVYVHEKIYEPFIEKLKAWVQQLKVGDPFHPETFQGPQISKNQLDSIMALVQSGKDEGATTLLGGNRHGDEGYFVEPTIFTDVKPHMRIVKEEIFGPVIVVSKFHDDDDILHQANDSMYGLAAAVFAKDISRAIGVAQKLHAGTVWVNCYNQLEANVPFGGYKQSGIGRELGEYALANYTNVKSIHINLTTQM